MTTRRVVIGKYNDGVTFGLRVSHAGIDALTGDSSGGDFAFDSNWSDITKINSIGLAAWSATAFVADGGLTISGFLCSWPSLGYKPFAECRLVLNSNVVYDDYSGSLAPRGCYGYMPDTLPDHMRVGLNGLSSSYTLIYITYKIPVPTQ